MSVLYRDTTLTKIFVGGLPYHTTDESLQKFFDQFGPIEEAVVITDRHSGKSKGYGFVTMADRIGAEKACKDPNPIIDGRKANVNLAYLGAKPRLQAGEILSFPINLKTGLTSAYPTHLSRTPAFGRFKQVATSRTFFGNFSAVAHPPLNLIVPPIQWISPFIQPAAPAFITAHPATLAPLTTIHPNNGPGGVPSTANHAVYPVSPGTPNGTPTPTNGIINYAPTAFAFPHFVHPGFEAPPAAYAPFSVIGYISPQPASTAYNPQTQQQQVVNQGAHSPTVGAPFMPALHCVPTQQILH